MKVYYKKLDIMTGVIKNLKETSLSIHKSSFNFFLAYLRDSKAVQIRQTGSAWENVFFYRNQMT